MKFQEAIQKADELSYKFGIGRVTLNIVEHPKTKKLHIVEELARYDKEGREIKTRFQTHLAMDQGKINVDHEVDYLKTVSTYRFLGEKVPKISDLKEYVLDRYTVGLDEPVNLEQAKPVETEPEEAPKKAASNPVGKAKAKAKEKAKAQAKTEPKAKAAAKNVKFDRRVATHVKAVALIVLDVLGKDWKNSGDHKKVVSDLVLKHLDSKVEVFGSESDEVLPAFVDFVKSHLAERIPKEESEGDVLGEM